MPTDVTENEERYQIRFVPLREGVVGPDGRVPLKLVGPGWGTSGYYPAAMLRRDGPRVFGEGTKMFWNHDTDEELAARPEGDLDRYAARLVTDARWDANGAAGPGLYAEAEVFESFRDKVNEKLPEVSLHAFGRAVMGEAEGREGPIVQELLAARSVDWVTEGGAGGRIVTLTEAAVPAAGKQAAVPAAGKQAARPGTPLRLQGTAEADTTNAAAAAELREAHNVAEWLESRLHLRLTEIADDLFGWGYVTREERIVLSGAIGQALNAYHAVLEDEAPQLFARGRYDEPAGDVEVGEGKGMEDGMADETGVQSLTEAQRRIEALEAEREASAAQLARLQEQLTLREAREFVAGRLQASDLPALTQERLLRSLVARAPLAEGGGLDTAAFGELADAAIQEAAAEVAAIVGDGQIRGMGARPETADAEVTLEEAQRRLDGALVTMGYGTAD